jgi:hypothetical protein
MANSRRKERFRRGAEVLAQQDLEPPPVRPSAADSDTAVRWQEFLLHAGIIVLAVLWIYSPMYHPFFPADWLWDDDQLLTANPVVQSTTLSSLAKLWFYPDGADYFPLSYTALWLQWPLFKMWPTGYHVTTILLHLVGALLVWRLFAEMRIPGAWLGALVFAIHPVCVESVAWVSELKNTLSLPLFLLSAIHFIRYDDAVTHGETQPGFAGDPPAVNRDYLLSLGYFLLSMLAKTSVVMMPVVLLLYAWWKRGGVTFRDVVRSAPFFLISLVLGLVTIYYQHGRAIGQETIIVGGADSRLASSGMSVLWYLKLIFWPVNLLPIYTKWEVDPPKAWQFLPWPIIAGACWWFWKHRAAEFPRDWGRHALFGFGFFLIMVAPVLGFITISYMRITWAADHFIYLPMIGIVALIAAGIATWYERTPLEERPVLVAGTAVVLAALMFLAFRYAGCWVNEDALWTHTLTYNENAWQAHNRLGAKKFSRGHVENIEPSQGIPSLGAFHHFTRSTALRPDLGETHNNLGTALSARANAAAQRGDGAAAMKLMDEAIKEFAEACRVTPHVPAIHVNLANALASANRFEEAAEKYRWLIERDPRNPAFINNYGVALYKIGKTEEAIQQFQQALEIAPNLKDAQESLAIARGEKPDPSAAQPPRPAPRPAEQPLSLPESPTLGPPRDLLSPKPLLP